MISAQGMTYTFRDVLSYADTQQNFASEGIRRIAQSPGTNVPMLEELRRRLDILNLFKIYVLQTVQKKGPFKTERVPDFLFKQF